MRIAILGLKGIPATYGGVERYTEELATRLAARGHEILVYARTHYTSKELARKPYQGIQLVRLPSLNLKTTDTLSHTLLSTLDVITQRHVDTVIYQSLGNAFMSVLPRLAGIPTILVLHTEEWRMEKWKGATAQVFLRASERVSFSLATHVCVTSQWLQENLRLRYGREAGFASQGITLPELRPMKNLETLGLTSRGYILFVGRLVPQKGVHLLLEAYSKLQTDMPLVIVGDAPHQKKYQDQLRSLATPGVRFLGFRYGDELAELYSHAYVYVLPSSSEGIAFTLLEALAFNNCVLVSTIPANIEAAGPSGFFFQSGDTSDLCRVLGELLAHPDLVAERRGQARAHIAQQYNWDRVADYYEQLCLALTTPDKGAHR
ncbi:MAG TPA: glycosyltransferase family 4 protein [Ktedonobacterales bacterium]|jgi:glycosyltransferase involved in cell wall biosynthesis